MNLLQARELAESMLSEKRLYHSLCVAEMARELAPAFGADCDRAELAGLLHDILKEQPEEVLLKWMGGSAIIDGNDLTDVKAVWHAYAAGNYVKLQLGLDEDIANAVRYHSVGKADMTPLEKAVYLADYISKDRSFPGSAEVRETAKTNKDWACFQAAQNMILHLTEQGRAVDRNSIDAYNSFLKKCK